MYFNHDMISLILWLCFNSKLFSCFTDWVIYCSFDFTKIDFPFQILCHLSCICTKLYTVMFLVYDLEVVVTWNIQPYLILELFWNSLRPWHSVRNVKFWVCSKRTGVAKKITGKKKDHQLRRNADQLSKDSNSVCDGHMFKCWKVYSKLYFPIQVIWDKVVSCILVFKLVKWTLYRMQEYVMVLAHLCNELYLKWKSKQCQGYVTISL